jgi:segregation and condensation protein A
MEQIDNKFTILLNGYEGPIDLLLDLAKKQKVDLSKISILNLAEQYIEFINKYKNLHLEVAADYLVMAAWLTYLKSRLLLPKEEKIADHTSEELEDALRYQIQRLEAIQNISKSLYYSPLVDRDIFYGGSSDGIKVKYDIQYSSTLYDLIKSYSNIVFKQDTFESLKINSSELQSVDQALDRLKAMFGKFNEWTNFMSLIPNFGINNLINKSYVTSNFLASLELAKNGFIEVKQNETFGNIFVKTKSL